MHTRRLTFLFSLLVLSCSMGTAWAVTPTGSALPFDAAGAQIHQSGVQVWVPLMLFAALVGLAGVIAFGAHGAAGRAVRVLMAAGVLSLACTGLGLATLFPGLVTALVLP